MKYTLRYYQQEASDAGYNFLTDKKKNKHGFMVLPTAAGKCHRRGTKILMYDGYFKMVENITVGDNVMGVDSKPNLVASTHTGFDNMYKINQIKGDTFYCNEGHILSLICNGNKSRYKKGEIVNINIKNYLKLPKSVKHVLKMYKSEGVVFNERKTFLDPYFVGLWLADGSKTDGHQSIITVNSDDIEILDYLKEYGATYIEKYNDKNCCKVSFTGGKFKQGRENIIINELRKFYTEDKKNITIDRDYLINSKENRLKLLAGLLDGDGYCAEGTYYEIITKYETLRDDILYLCRSLGFMVKSSIKIAKIKSLNFEGEYHRINIYGKHLDQIPVKLPRKKATPRKQIKNALRTGFSVECIGEGEYFGFSLSGDDKRYMLEDFTVTHNSLVVADLSNRLEGNVLVLQPTKELLSQNYDKYLSYENEAAIYSASLSRKEIGKVTFATIGSIYKKPELFKDFSYIIVDECHIMSVEDSSMHKKFLSQVSDFKLLGLSATPFRLKAYNYPEPHAKLNFLNRMRPKIFQELVYVYQIQDAVKNGYWSPLIYRQYDFNTSMLKLNTTGANYTDSSVNNELLKQSVPDRTITVARKLLREGRKHTLIFMPDILISDYVAKELGTYSITSKTHKKDREKWIKDFMEGKVPYLVNANILQVGFDFPEIDGIIDAFPTLSLARYYQRLGRAVRPDLKEVKTKKDAIIVDMVGNYNMFGKIEDLKIENLTGKESGWCVTSNGNILTNTPIQKGDDLVKKIDYQIYTDGSANWKNGKGGCAAVFVKDEEVVNVYSKGLTNTKTGRSEIHAILMALKNIPNDVEKIIINSDSQYCVNTIEKGWLDNWLRSDEQKKNMDLWIEVKKHLDNLKRRNINCKLHHIKGHNGNLYNELADYYADYKRYL